MDRSAVRRKDRPSKKSVHGSSHSLGRSLDRALRPIIDSVQLLSRAFSCPFDFEPRNTDRWQERTTVAVYGKRSEDHEEG